MAQGARILLVDDEPPILRSLTPLLESRGFVVDTAATGRGALHAFERQSPDLMILDLALPDIDGNEVCARVRSQTDVPIIVLSARTTEGDKIAALDRGADDYLTKPFSPEELLARVRVALRRVFGGPPARRERIRLGDMTIDFERRRVFRAANDEIRLTPKEFDLLSYLARHPNQVMTRDSILIAVWGRHAAQQPEHLWVLVAQLRKKLEPDPSRPRYLVSEPWVGYRLVTDE